MLQSGGPSFKEKLVNKTVIVKVSLFTRAFSGTITAADDTGFCLVSDEMNAALREITGVRWPIWMHPAFIFRSRNSSGSFVRSPKLLPPQLRSSRRLRSFVAALPRNQSLPPFFPRNALPLGRGRYRGRPLFKL